METADTGRDTVTTEAWESRALYYGEEGTTRLYIRRPPDKGAEAFRMELQAAARGAFGEGK